MQIQLCSRCKTRPASVMITRTENGKTITEGICLICAREMGIKPVEDMLRKMGMNDSDIESMSEQMEQLMESAAKSPADDGNSADHGEVDGGAPAIDIRKLFSGFGLTPPDPAGTTGVKKEIRKKAQNDESRKFLSMYCTNLTEKAARGNVDRIVGREREINRVIQILCRRQKNNPCLIGEPGVGKTAIAEALAQRIVDGKVPDRLRDSEIWMLDLTSLVAGTQFRGQFESRILGLIKEVKAAGNVILMIDEVHNIVGAGDSEGSMSAANMLKPALSRGEIQVIGATTLKEYRKFIEKDSALERRFQPITVTEPSVDDTVQVISGIRSYYEKFHGVKITDEIARRAVLLSERYITDRFLPDKAIDLIDEACAKAALNSPQLNEHKRNLRRLEEIRQGQAALETSMQKPEMQTESNYKTLADLKAEQLRIENREEELAPEVAALSVSIDDLASVVEVWTGVPSSDIKAGEIGELTGLYERISSKLIGQSEAVSAVVRAVRRKRAGVSYRRSPVSMIFAGPTGVGKTELVKVLANELFKQPESLIRLDMSEFMEKHSVSRIIGAPPGYVGYDEAGQLTEKIRRRPYAVILFDEIEKAHPDVLNILLQILDDGRITDAQGREVNFENTIIIMTTNAGSETSHAISGFSEKRETLAAERTERALFSFLRPEFINRVDEIITFRHLDRENFKAIARLQIGLLADSLADKNIRLEVTDGAIDLIAEKSFSEKFGARNMKRLIEREVEDVIANILIEHSGEKIIGIVISEKDKQFVTDFI